MRTFAIVKKVLRELFRDKRTLAMMFIAPIFIMWLLNVMFSASTTTEVKLATIHLDKQLVQKLEDIDHVTLKSYTSVTEAKRNLKEEKVDGIIKENNDKQYEITYANYDSSKTIATRQVFSTALTQMSTEKLKDTVVKLTESLAQAKEQLAKATATSGQTVSQAAQSSEQLRTASIQQHYIYGNKDTGFFNKMIPILMGFIVFFFVFLISGIALLKERTSGTLDRLLATPVKRSEIVLGYMISYGIIAILQTTVIVFATIYLLDIEVVGSIIDVMIVNFLLALVALSFGFFLSTLAKSEFQMMQFIPIVVMPQMMFSGIIPLENMASWVQVVGKFLPLSYSGQAMTDIIIHGQGLEKILPQLGVLTLFTLVLTVLNIEGLRRYRKV
ncbi:ABC transporter permease [Streptococcus massiliensis]|uniref:ABC transporter n=1 Tax=Streptococcus massiliensis TaxID=313439 RepID=A0A380L062_9STRE|nr:ABC transporter permease [Streptococcus massiliensis]SUN76939.1 ABC transporter [Streptococcus massiliensis]